MSLWEKYELTIKKILAIIIAIVVFGWMMLTEEIDTDELDIIYKCEIALRSHDIPEHIRQQCIKLLKDRHETEPDQ